MDSETKSAFLVLKPVCDKVALSPSKSTLWDLKATIGSVPISGLLRLKDYVIFPLELHLHNHKNLRFVFSLPFWGLCGIDLSKNAVTSIFPSHPSLTDPSLRSPDISLKIIQQGVFYAVVNTQELEVLTNQACIWLDLNWISELSLEKCHASNHIWHFMCWY